MSFFNSMDISASGMSVERFKMDLIAQNIANASTTQANGQPYRRKVAVVGSQEMGGDQQFAMPVNFEEGGEEVFAGSAGGGVQVQGVAEDNGQEALKYVYDPDHPQAITSGKWKGYVVMPNINVITEMTNMISASRSYEANATAVEAAKAMALKTLDIGQAG